MKINKWEAWMLSGDVKCACDIKLKVGSIYISICKSNLKFYLLIESFNLS